MVNILVSNGTASQEVLDELLPWMDAINIDLKGFRQEYYEKLGGDLETVKTFIAKAAESCHVELTTLIVPGENDSLEDMEEQAKWIAGIHPAIPLHITRFFPRYRMQDRDATDVEQLYRLARTAERYLKKVYVGNV